MYLKVIDHSHRPFTRDVLLQVSVIHEAGPNVDSVEPIPPPPHPPPRAASCWGRLPECRTGRTDGNAYTKTNTTQTHMNQYQTYTKHVHTLCKSMHVVARAITSRSTMTTFNDVSQFIPSNLFRCLT